MHDAFAPCSPPSRGCIIDCLSLKKLYHTFTVDVTNAHFHVDDDEVCYVDPPAECLEKQAALENPTSVLWRFGKKLSGRRHAGTRWVARLEEQSFDRCEAAPQFFANYELDVLIEVHMDDLHGTGPKLALDVLQTNLSQTIRFIEWTNREHRDDNQGKKSDNETCVENPQSCS